MKVVEHNTRPLRMPKRVWTDMRSKARELNITIGEYTMVAVMTHLGYAGDEIRLAQRACYGRSRHDGGGIPGQAQPDPGGAEGTQPTE